MKSLILAALVAALALPALAAEITLGGNTYYVYGNASWAGLEPSTQLVLLDAVAESQPGTELPFNSSATPAWDTVKDSIAAGHLVASLWERQSFAQTVDHKTVGELVVPVVRRDSLLTVRYRALRILCAYDVPECRPSYDMPDSVAVSIGSDTTRTPAATITRLKAALVWFKTNPWAVPDTTRPITLEKWQELTQ